MKTVLIVLSIILAVLQIVDRFEPSEPKQKVSEQVPQVEFRQSACPSAGLPVRIVPVTYSRCR